MAITSQDGLVAALTGGDTFAFPALNIGNSSLVNAVTGMALMSSWTGSSRTGYVPSIMRAPETCDATTVGAAPLPTLTSGNQYYLANLAHGGSLQSTIMVLDRLAHVRVDPTLTTAQTVNMTLPARAGARGVIPFVEMTANTTGASSLAVMPGTISVSYTNELGQSGRTATGFDLAGTATNRGSAAGGLLPLMMSADHGVASVETVTFGTAPGSSFSLLVVLARPVYFAVQNSYGASQAGFMDGLGVSLGTSPCLFYGQNLTGFSSTNAPGTLLVRIVQG